MTNDKVESARTGNWFQELAGDDAYAPGITLGSAPASTACVDSGADGIAATRAEGPDLRIAVAKPVSLGIRKGRDSAGKRLKFTIANVEFGDAAPAVRAFRLNATRGSCPGGTVTQLDADAKAGGLQATATVALGKKAKASLLVTARLEDVTTVAKNNPFRCTFTVSAVALDTDPAPDDAANQENNETQVLLEVTDQNDL